MATLFTAVYGCKICKIWLGLKPQIWPEFQLLGVLKNVRLGLSCQWQLPLAQLQPKPQPVQVKCTIIRIYQACKGPWFYNII